MAGSPERVPRRAWALVVVALLSSAGVALAAGSAGGTGRGDPIFPKAGNGGYDVAHYDLELRYRSARDRLWGQATIEADSNIALSSFSLDLRPPLRVKRVRVNGRLAPFDHSDNELVITPTESIPAAAPFRTRVIYRGTPRPRIGPGFSKEGWLNGRRGPITPNEPVGASSWFPANDHPSDKATYAIAIEVKRGLKAISNGELVGRSKTRTRSRFEWEVRSPMASYLSMVAIGKYKVSTPSIAGVPSWIAIDRSLRGRRRGLIRKMRRVVAMLKEQLGPYPFDQTGAVIHTQRIGYALETQTRPLYPRTASAQLIAHELAHEYFGNLVTPRQWDDIWLNEGFATWVEWLWLDRGAPKGRRTLEQSFGEAYREHRDAGWFWRSPPGVVLNERELFADPVYVRGAMVLHALYTEIGEVDFFEVLHRWLADHADANATTEDFIGLAEIVSGSDLGELFEAWLYSPTRPPKP